LPHQKEAAHRQFKEVSRMLEAFERYFGKYPFYEDGYKLVTVPYPEMEHQSSVTYGNCLGMTILQRDPCACGFVRRRGLCTSADRCSSRRPSFVHRGVRPARCWFARHVPKRRRDAPKRRRDASHDYFATRVNVNPPKFNDPSFPSASLMKPITSPFPPGSITTRIVSGCV